VVIQELRDNFKGKEVFIVGGGPSLKNFDFECLRDKTTISVNHSFKYVPNTNLITHLDWRFVREYGKDETFINTDKLTWSRHLRNNKYHEAKLYPRAYENTALIHGTHYHQQIGLSKAIDKQHPKITLHTSGQLAILFCIAARASKVYLLGFDACQEYKEHNQFHDFFPKNKTGAPAYMKQSVALQRMFDKFNNKEEIGHFSKNNIINLNPESCMGVFQKMSPDFLKS